MIRTFCLVALMLLNIMSYAQSYVGFTTDNYSGIHGVLANPASISDSRLEFDLNIVSLSTYFGNDYTPFKLSDALNGDLISSDDNLTITNENSAIYNLDILGPSFMFNLNNRSAIGITTRARFFANINSIDGNAIKLFDSGLSENNPTTVENINATATGHGWTEYGISYGGILLDKKTHFVKAGITAKYLQGRGFVTLETTDASIDFDPDATPSPEATENGRVTGGGFGNYSYSSNLDRNNNTESFDSRDDVNFSAQTAGIGLDIGLIYEWRPNSEKFHTTDIDGNRAPLKALNKYKVKVGLSITDIGSLTYKDAFSNFYDLNTSVDKQLLENGNFERDIEILLEPELNSVNKKIKLPTAVHTNIDWNVYKKIYLNANGDLSLIKKQTNNTNRIANTVSITPRYESKWISIYSPVSYREFGDLAWGIGLRAGPLFLGSGSILTNILSDKSKTADVYMGIKVPIFQKKLLDKDGDGVTDEFDECPNEAGSIENYGCPGENKAKSEKQVDATDSDEDGIIDSLDECPYKYGNDLNNGCPENETGNTLEDAVVEKLEKSLTKYSRTINFNYNKATLSKSTYPSLKSILELLEEYPSAQILIEGHTDNIGSLNSNLILSKRRALAVKAYFMEQGISKTRLLIKGFGEIKPVSTNTTPLGRSKNRRVEVKLIK